MPVEQRVVSRQKIGGGAPSARVVPPPDATAASAPRSRRGLVVVVAVVLVLAVAAAAAWFLLGRDTAEVPAAPPPPEAGEVLQVEAISINLADGHYLRLGLGLQLTADVHEALDPSRALDLAIAQYSGRSVAEVSEPATRDALKTQLAEKLAEAYEGEVMDVYLTNYVTQ